MALGTPLVGHDGSMVLGSTPPFVHSKLPARAPKWMYESPREQARNGCNHAINCSFRMAWGTKGHTSQQGNERRGHSGPSTGQAKSVEELWREFFSNPSKWWDSRTEKVNARYPDFKHKETHESLWVNGKSNPTWVEAELATMLPGTVQLDLFTWNNRLSRSVKAGQFQKTMELFRQMQQQGMQPNTYSYVPVLKACAGLQALQEGRNIHLQIVESNCNSDVHVSSCLIDMYAKCGSIEDARRLFDKMSKRDVVSWNSMIQVYVKCGQGQKALELSRQMYLDGVQPNHVTFLGLLNACSSKASLREGLRVHGEIIRRGYESDILVANCLIDMYAKCGSMIDAQRVFNKMPIHDVVSWNGMILGYAKCGEGPKALKMSRQMQREDLEPSIYTLIAMLNACASAGLLKEGRKVHEQIIQSDCISDVTVASSLVDMYAKCGSTGDARIVFDAMPIRNVVSWNAMILGYVKCAQAQKALELYQRMQKEGVEPDSITFVGALNACASVGALEEGRHVHEQIIRSGFETNVYVGSALINMYGNCASIDDAWGAFIKLPIHDVACWNAMILGYVKCRQGQKALAVYRKMLQEGVEPKPATFVGVLNACAAEASLDEGMRVHEHIIQSGCESEVFVASCLVDMYAKCGSIENARRVFSKMPMRNVVSWTAMLGGYAIHGLGNEAIEHFKQMHQEGIEINGVTFMSLLSACRHSGLVDEGLHFFESMSSVYAVSATPEHYACVVDLLGRAGYLHEAEDLVKVMTCQPNITSWMSLLGACRIYDNIEIGERVAKQVLKLQPENAAGYVLLSNLYSATS